MWTPLEGDGPWCTFPDGFGYSMDGSPVDTPLGFTASLSRKFRKEAAPSPTALNDLTLTVEYHTPTRLRIKVMCAALF